MQKPMELVQILFFVSDVHAGVIADAPPLISYFISTLRFLLSIVTAVAVIAIIVSGVMYMTAGGDVGRATSAKAYLLWSVAGLCIALLSFVAVLVLTSTLGL